MLSITGIAASAFVIWKVRTIPRRAIAYGRLAEDRIAREASRPRRRPGRSPVITLKKVVLPAPFGPISAVIDPSRDRHRRAVDGADAAEALDDAASASKIALRRF